jgi:hypothetical protein
MSRADHEGDQVVAEADEDRHHEGEDHDGPVHGEDLVIEVRVDQPIVRHR